jgi:hypothetical protein
MTELSIILIHNQKANNYNTDNIGKLFVMVYAFPAACGSQAMLLPPKQICNAVTPGHAHLLSINCLHHD